MKQFSPQEQNLKNVIMGIGNNNNNKLFSNKFSKICYYLKLCNNTMSTVKRVRQLSL